MSMMTIDNGADVVGALRAKLADFRRDRAKRAGWSHRFLPTGLTVLDCALPGGGLPSGTIAEIFADADGVGSLSLAMRIAKSACGMVPNDPYSLDDRRAIVVVDTRGDFYPPGAWQKGIDPDRLIVVRPRNTCEAFWAADQSLRCVGVAVVIAPLDRLDDRQSRRLQLAAESSGCVGVILRPAQKRCRSFAAVQMLVEGIGTGSLSLSQPVESPRERKLTNATPKPFAASRRLKPAAQGKIVTSRTSSTRAADGMESRPVGSPRDDSGGIDRSFSNRYSRRLKPAAQGEVVYSRRLKPAAREGDDGWYGVAVDGRLSREAHFCRITILKIPEGVSGQEVLVDLNDEAGVGTLFPVPLDGPVAKRA